MTINLLTSRFGAARGLLGLWTVVLALAAQLMLGAVVPAPEGDAASVASAPFTLVICHGDDTSSGTPLHHHRQSDCASCPFCRAFTHAAMALLPAPIVFEHPLPPARVVAVVQLARGPPTHTVRRYPTGPPSLT